jgi:hypothetical protein
MDKLQAEMQTLLDKYGVTLQIRQDIVFVPKKTMEEEIVVTPEVTEEVAEETAPEVVAE